MALQPLAVDAQTVLERLGGDRMLLVDARSADRFRGENETLDPLGGHIPGALNRPFRDNLGTDGLFKQASQLREEFGDLLHGGDAHRVVHQCGSGVTACHNLLAMEVAGLTGSRLYPGSWSEWCADPARPVAAGPA
jgi:thiosulfate/3-mercaptopyruvate sulfurtransferase